MARPTPDPSSQLTYRSDEKAALLAAFERLENVSAAARELGLNAATCNRWLLTAGIDPKRRSRRRRAEYFRLRADGVPRPDAARAVQLNLRTAIDWDQGIIHANNRRVYPDGRVVDYNKIVTLPTNSPASTALPTLERELSSRFLSLLDRERIRDLSAAGTSLRSIAAVLQRPPSTISRELRRNRTNTGAYEPYAAHRSAAERRPRPKAVKLVHRHKLHDYVQTKLLLRWSPEQISNSLNQAFPADVEMRVSPESIYQALYLQAQGGLRREVSVALRTGRSRRKPRKAVNARRSRFVDAMTMVADRPLTVEDRTVPGHWEGDLITGTYNQSAIGTLVERTTRAVKLIHLPRDHGAEAVRDGLLASLSALPKHLRTSLTWDQGVEMALHKSFSKAAEMDVYFCDRASPWQRGSNENTNGLLRQYFPKGTDLSTFTLEDLERVTRELINRPRKSLNWDTPAERFSKLLGSV
jgi:IS30 family transposase